VELLTASAASARLGITTNSLAKARKRGSIPASWDDRVRGYIYRIEDLDAYASMRDERSSAAAERRRETEIKRREAKERAAAGLPHKSDGKLTAADARAIRESRESINRLAQAYGVSKSTIRNIQLGRRWASAGGPMRMPSTLSKRWIPSDSEIEAVTEALSSRGAWSDAANAVGVSASTVQSWAARERRDIFDIGEAAARRVVSEERELFSRLIDARRQCKSWADAAGIVGISESKAGTLRLKFPERRSDCERAARDGRRFYERSVLETAICKISTAKTWNNVAASMGLSAGTLMAIRKRHPDLDEKCRAARKSVKGWVTTGTLYVIKDGHGMIKVGRTANLDSRLQSLARGNSSGTLDVLFSAEVANVGDVEGNALRRLRPHRIHGEWFNVDPDKAVSIAKDEVKKSSDGVQTRIL